MQTVSFQCGHCHKVMGVTSAHLGKQVRCPHCKQVVTAPAQAPAAAPAPPAPAPVVQAPASPRATPDPLYNFSSGPPAGRDEHESIFGEHVAEDLFDMEPKAKIELPPEAARPNLQLEPTVFQMPGLPANMGASDLGPTANMQGNSYPGQAPLPPTVAVTPSPSDWANAAAPASTA